MTLRPFHLAFPVNDLAAAREFYGDAMGCREGRSSDEWVDFDFYGHQIVAHHSPEECRAAKVGEVDGQGVPVGVGLPTLRIDAITVGGTESA